MLRRLLSFTFLFAVISLLPKAGTTLQAQPKVPSPITLSANAPTLSPIAPWGGIRGTTIELTMMGTNLNEPLQVWTSFPANATIPPENNNGKDAARFNIKLEIASDAPVGPGLIRVLTKQGVSNARLFVVDDVPTVMEVNTNKAKDKAQPITLPVAVAGKIDNESSDFYRFTGKAGQKLSFELIARRIGSALDPMIYLYDAKSGRDLPGGYADDSPGLQGDARLSFTLKQDGDYILEVRDSIYRGGADYFYRLKIGDFPFATAATPVAIKRGQTVTAAFTGSDVDQVAPVSIGATLEPGQLSKVISPKRGNGLSGWPVEVRVTDFDVVTEVEPNQEPSKAMKLTLPIGVSAKFAEKGDVDYFAFPGKKGKKVTITAETSTILSPAEVYLVIKDTKGAELAKSNPQNPTAIVEFTPPADDEYVILAEHLLYAHGPNEIYFLTVKEEGSFDVQVGLDRFELSNDGRGYLPLMSVNRKDYAGPIEISVAGNPKLHGTITIPATVTQAAANQVLALLPIQAKLPLTQGIETFHLVAKATVDGKEISRPVSVSEVIKPTISGTNFPPSILNHSLAVGFSQKPFGLKAKLASPELFKGSATNLVVSIERGMGFVDEVTLLPLVVPANVTVATKPIPKDAKEVTIPITPAANAAVGEYSFVFRASVKRNNIETVVYSEPIVLKISEPKKVEPKKEEPKKVEPKKEEPKKVEPKKVEPKKEEAKKVEPKKEEPKKVEPKKK
jgi:hypothetical protein